MKRKISLISIVSVAVGGFLFGCKQDPGTLPSELSIRPVNVINLQAQDQISIQRFSGVIASQHTANLAFRVPGTIESLLVLEGDSVKKGQVLARLDPHDFQVTLNQAKAQLSEAQAAYKLSKIERKRTQQATSDNAIAHINLDRAISAESRAKANVELATQSLVKAKDALRYTELKAPFDGVVAKRFIDEHEQTLPGIKVMTVHQPNQLEAIANVPERKMHLIHPNMTATIHWFEQGEGIEATVSKISNIPDPLTRTYDVTFNLSTIPPYLFSGKAVNIDLTASTPKDHADKSSFCVPSVAVVNVESQSHVIKVIDKKAQFVPVTIQSGLDDKLCVQGDITIGNTIVTAGSAYLKPGDSIHSLNEVKI